MSRVRTALTKVLRAVVGFLLLLVGIAGFFALPASFASYPVVPPKEGAPRWVRGAYHVHTTRSDGRGSPQEVARAAKEAGLDFVVLTDHNDFKPPAPAWVDGVLLVPGVEISTSSGHLAAFGMERPLEGVRQWMPPGDAVKAVAAAGGTAVLAHPVQKRNPWTDDASAREAPGFELYSADTFFRQAVSNPVSRLLPAVGAYLGNPGHGVMLLVTPEPEPAARFMELSRAHPRIALCAHDAHGLPSYEAVFESMAMYLPPELVPAPLPKDAAEAAARVTKALGSGRALCAFRALGEPEGFALSVVAPADEAMAGVAPDHRDTSADAVPDGTVPERREAKVGDVLEVRLPGNPEEGSVRVQVWGDGKLRPDGRSVELTGPGVVQVEVWARAPGRFFGTEWRPWIVPSPVRVVPRGPGI
ncbi:PHP domain-containing protein [Pyxidicoccus parkwayensis]|uniref:PHP domain-containing protein n=1 Tax=Pyxidicoccus parkwayensis TaxID=2813578 RepID=A0ABX7P3F7_9BACT|nr:PHP domain-containing protein [Pyxidicoccus parkwaysis]QSQ24972.1 PHP domain-containing protein [Pyxidicoccus parkwaysis]